MTKTKKQHYLPQTYLRNFSKDEYTWACFINKDNNIQRNKISNLFYHKNLYTINEGYKTYNNEDISSLFFESDYFAQQIEPGYKEVIDKVLIIKNKFVKTGTKQLISFNILHELAYYIIIQFLRLPEKKDYISSFFESDSMKKLTRVFLQNMALLKNDNNYKNLDITFDNNDPALNHALMMYYNTTIIEKFAEELYENKIWDFIIDPNQNICTGDNPFIKFNPINFQRPLNMGLNTHGSVILFPLSADLYIKMSDKNTHAHLIEYDRTFRIADENNIKTFNKMLYDQTKNTLICKNHKFDFLDVKPPM